MAGASFNFPHRQFFAASLTGSGSGSGGGGRGGGAAPPLPEKLQDKKVLILGGTGRIGSSTARALTEIYPPSAFISLAGTGEEKASSVLSTLGENAKFVEVDIDNKKSLEAALDVLTFLSFLRFFCIRCGLGCSCAGPFQRAENCNVLDIAISTKVNVLHSLLHATAVAADVPAITTAGIYPGVSNVMAAELVRAARSDRRSGEPARLRFFYFTAGTGGAGPTILATSFLLLGEDVEAYNKGEKIKLKPYTGMMNIDFGKGIGKRDVYLLNLPEVSSTHKVLGVPTVSARFGTAPFFWNWGLIAVGNLLPAEFLQDRSKVQKLVQIFDPIVRATDALVGERVSMRVDLECSNGLSTLGIFSHRRLSVSVGVSTAAFALSVLEGNSQPGVWFPERYGFSCTGCPTQRGIPIEAREVLLRRASQGTINFMMNKPPWMVETDPKELGLGIYV
ncbi:unnamed protein product [Spirodela intermedia]|uniref:Uncharacterized protein n=1 Tax=Spirodela intermedia TaxID=51605 RepID=A0A7I8IVZ4_SPIIN|nr:unnamed protein product [Spirodela intermedia]CAA6662148.1 unnamed protein product [Spirodela intermedia]